MQRLWIVSEPYYPEQTSTGYFVTGIAEGLSRRRDVSVICSMRAPEALQAGLQRAEVRNGVSVHRAGPRLGKPRLLGLRALAHALMALAIGWKVWRLVRPGDEVLAVTTPFFLPFIAYLPASWRGADFDLLVHDVYPDTLVVAGVIRDGGLLHRLLDALTKRLYRRCRQIVVLSEDMRDVVAAKLDDARIPIHIVPNWGDVERIRPKPRDEVELLRRLELTEKFVVQYGGNLGRTHGVELLIEAAELLRHETGISFLIIGSGAADGALRRVVAALELDNVRFLGRSDPRDYADTINACDLAVVMLRHGMAGLSAPSRVYNLLAAGRPLLVVAEAHSAPARLVETESVGWTLPPGDAQALKEAILAARRDAEQRRRFTERARELAERRFGYTHSLERYERIYGPGTSPEPAAD